MSQNVVNRIRLLEIPGEVCQVMARIREQGGQVYVVGGLIRDWVWHPEMSRPATLDWDLVTDLPPEHLRKLTAMTHAGERFGTYRFGPHIEVTVMRSEANYADGRHPSQVAWTNDIHQDLARRDFTVNAVAYDGESLYAAAGAIEDLAARKIRAVGDPRVRFHEDALRILRMARLAGNHQASIDEETRHAGRSQVMLTRSVSRERRLHEMVRFLASPLDDWPLWDDLGLDVAWEWPEAPRPAPLWRLFVTAPTSPAARLLAYFLMRYPWHGAALRSWTESWPLPRAWRLALGHFGRDGELNVKQWCRIARWERHPYTWLYRDLALAAGCTAEELSPRTLAVTASDLGERWAIRGRAVKDVLAYLHEAVERDPRLNEPKKLAALIQDWQARHERQS
ncbi:MAG: hypothetical protein OWU84_10975 [Firmicutes bacterium]|nr:hypothetical protein [Bacillota bacterium]